MIWSPTIRMRLTQRACMGCIKVMQGAACRLELLQQSRRAGPKGEKVQDDTTRCGKTECCRAWVEEGYSSSEQADIRRPETCWVRNRRKQICIVGRPPGWRPWTIQRLVDVILSPLLGSAKSRNGVGHASDGRVGAGGLSLWTAWPPGPTTQGCP